MLATLGHILLQVQLPVLVLIAVGALVQRTKTLDLPTLVKLNLHLFVPAFLFVRVAESRLPWLDIGKIGLAILLAMALLAVPLWLALRQRQAPPAAIAAVVTGGVFFNAGNFGVPVVHLAFGQAGDETQALVVMFVNTAIFFVGYVIMALAQGRSVAAGAAGYFKLPMVYALAAGLLVRATDVKPWSWLNHSLRMAADALIPIALVTLGAQLALRPRWPQWRLIAPTVALKLLVMPLVTAGVVWALDLWPMPGAVLILASAAPTAVNTLLLTLELGGDGDTAADVVFWTTIVSTVTVAVVLTVLVELGGQPLHGTTGR
jgi:predicted permease